MNQEEAERQLAKRFDQQIQTVQGNQLFLIFRTPRPRKTYNYLLTTNITNKLSQIGIP